MPRARPIFPVALSVQGASDALGIPERVIGEAVKFGELPAYQFQGSGHRIRILVADLTEWVRRTWPRATIARQMKQQRSQS